MKFTVSEAAERVNLSPHTIRYYDKEGLLPFITRTDSGTRYFSEEDIEGLEIINCLKSTGMPIKEIKIFMDWCLEGDKTIKQRYEMFLERREAVEAQIEELERALHRIDYKCWYYHTALEAGTLKVHENTPKYQYLKEIT